MKGIIDRFENGIAVVELETGTENIPLTDAPAGLYEGLIVEVTEGRITGADEEATALRNAALNRRFSRLKRRR